MAANNLFNQSVTMDNLDDSENNAKVSDSAYSNSCSNSQSRRSHSSKSTHSGSNSSGSSGYRGHPSTSGSSNQPPQKRLKEKEPKKKKLPPVETAEVLIEAECQPPDPAPKETAPEEVRNVDQTPAPALAHHEADPKSVDVPSLERLAKDESNPPVNYITYRPATIYCADGFSCVISMHDGVVMYTTSLLTTTLGFPKDMWIGRSFIDFIHPKDRNTFASQISSGLAVPKIVNGIQEKVQASGDSVSTMVCRIRRYRGLASGFCVKDRAVTFMPFLLKLSFKSVSDEEGELIYLVIQATPFFSAFKVPNEIILKPKQFVMRHAATGTLEYIDHESVPYLGYVPQDVIGEDALKLYHPDDMCYLGQVYETIVKEGGLSKSKPYRMKAQNGDYVKLETEWTSFINPWSRKLEFVVGKHNILEGPNNPDVFHALEVPEKPTKVNEEENNKQQSQRDSIIKTLNEVLTKPAEVAKQQMSKRCQDLAYFMESLMEEPKNEEELRLEIQDAHSYYERDSMLGGISPHHDFKDNKSSTGTPLSYNQLNYNENMQRYFDSHQSFSYEEFNAMVGDNLLSTKDQKLVTNLSPLAQHSGESIELASSCESGFAVQASSPPAPLGDYQQMRLTESLLTKHNSDMEKELLRVRRESRSSSKGEREKTFVDYRQKRKEHLARCNATFHPAALATTSALDPYERKTHGIKRSSKQVDAESIAHKHHCVTPRQARRRHGAPAPPALPTTSASGPIGPSGPIGGDSLPAPSHWHPNPVNNLNTYILGVGMPQPVSIISPVMQPQPVAMPGIIPMYYTPATSMPPSTMAGPDHTKTQPLPGPALPCMMYGQAVYGSPLVYSPIASQVAFPPQQSMMGQSMQCSTTLNPLGLASSNYEEACKPSVPLKLNKTVSGWRDKRRMEARAASSKDLESADSSTSTNALNRSTEAVPGSGSCPDTTKSKNTRNRTSDEALDRTDGCSSYSSFYSSFFKTESGSAEDSSDLKKGAQGKKKTSTSEFWGKSTNEGHSSVDATQNKEVPRRKMEPPWMEQVCVTSELIYKYQILTKSMEEVLLADKLKMSTWSQPSLVNEQLGQLYLDLQLQGVASRLTLEECVTSSSSSGEETCPKSIKDPKRKREYSKLMMIYEEDAPLPPPSTDDEMAPSPVS